MVDDTAVNLNLWPGILALHAQMVQAIPTSVRQRLLALAAAFGLAPRHFFHFVYVVENFDYTSLSTAHYQMRDPFDHPDGVEAFWTACIRAGFLETNVDGTLRSTEKSETARRQRWQLFNQALADLNLAPDAKVDRLNACLARLVSDTAVSTTPTSAWAFHTRQRAGRRPPVENVSPLVQLIEYRLDLGAFRDDAHLAAWRHKYPVTPHAWEMLGKIWQQPSIEQKELVANLRHRGFAAADTAAALSELLALGWVRQNQTSYNLTPEGLAVRNEAEQETNHLFYAPWSGLSESAFNTLQADLWLPENRGV